MRAWLSSQMTLLKYVPNIMITEILWRSLSFSTMAYFTVAMVINDAELRKGFQRTIGPEHGEIMGVEEHRGY